MAEIRQRKKPKKSKSEATPEEFCPEVVQSNTGAVSTVSLIGLLGAVGLVWFYANGGDASMLMKKAADILQNNPPTTLTDIGSDEFHFDAMKLSEVDCNERLPLFQINPKLRVFNWSISTSSSVAQEYFNEGVLIASGFVHDEARRSFRAALKKDPECAMCYWGVAYVTSTDINRPLTQPWLDEAREAAKQAVKYSAKLDQSGFEVALIKAMATRYPDERTLENGAEYEQKFADAMKPIADKFPNGNIYSLYCEALMDTMPWNYWIDRHTPKEKTKECFRALDRALEVDPKNMLALHLYIHIYEYSHTLDIAEKKADLLFKILEPTPGLGHLTHMPGHIYQRVGRHYDAIKANVQAWNVAEAYFKKCNIKPDSGYNTYYAFLYYPHRHAFALYSSVMTGQRETALKVATKMYKDCEFQLINLAWFHMYSAYPEMINIRFGKWDEVLKLDEEPPHTTKFAQAMRYVSHAIAYASKGDCKSSEKHYKKFQTIQTDEDYRNFDIFFSKAGPLLDIADSTYLAKKASKCDNKPEEALKHWKDAAEQDDNLPYIEPPYWYYNVRSCYGQELLNQKKYKEAEAVFKTDLVAYQNNGWSLRGLEIALEGQNKPQSQVNEVRAKRKHQFQHADFPIDVACF